MLQELLTIMDNRCYSRDDDEETVKICFHCPSPSETEESQNQQILSELGSSFSSSLTQVRLRLYPEILFLPTCYFL